jgi:hypothetical protein
VLSVPLAALAARARPPSWQRSVRVRAGFVQSWARRGCPGRWWRVWSRPAAPAGGARRARRRSEDDHRAVQDQVGGADPHDDACGAGGAAGGGGPQRVQAAVGGRADRPADGQRHVGDECGAVGGRDARRRGVRGEPVLVPLRERCAGGVRVPARDPDAPGARGGADPVRDDVQAGRRGAEQHALRHDASQRGGDGRACGGPAVPGIAGPSGHVPVQGQHGRGGAGVAHSRGRHRADPAVHDHADEQLGRRPACIDGEHPRGARRVPAARDPVLHRRVPVRGERVHDQAPRGGAWRPVGEGDRAGDLQPRGRLHVLGEEGWAGEHRRRAEHQRRPAGRAGEGPADPDGGLSDVRRAGRPRPGGDRGGAGGSRRRGLPAVPAGFGAVPRRAHHARRRAHRAAAGRPCHLPGRGRVPAAHPAAGAAGPGARGRAVPRGRDPRRGNRHGHVRATRPGDRRGDHRAHGAGAPRDPAARLHPEPHRLRRRSHMRRVAEPGAAPWLPLHPPGAGAATLHGAVRAAAGRSRTLPFRAPRAERPPHLRSAPLPRSARDEGCAATALPSYLG